MGNVLIRCCKAVAIEFPISSVLNADHEYSVSTYDDVSTVCIESEFSELYELGKIFAISFRHTTKLTFPRHW